MTTRFAPFVALAIALSMGSASASPVGRMVSLSPAADFEPGSSVVSELAQEQLDLVVSRFKTRNVESIVVTGFANTANPAENEAMAILRARGVKAFFTLNGIDPDRVFVHAGQPFEGKDRPGQIMFEVVGSR